MNIPAVFLSSMKGLSHHLIESHLNKWSLDKEKECNSLI